MTSHPLHVTSTVRYWDGCECGFGKESSAFHCSCGRWKPSRQAQCKWCAVPATSEIEAEVA